MAILDLPKVGSDNRRISTPSQISQRGTAHGGVVVTTGRRLDHHRPSAPGHHRGNIGDVLADGHGIGGIDLRDDKES